MLRPGLTECRRSAARCLAGLVIVAVCGAVSSRALCAENDKVVARAHYETATRIYDLREYAKALDEYKAAYLAKPDPAFLFNVGQCYRRLGKFDQALDFYREYLKKAPPDDPNRPNVEARIRNTDTGDVFETDTPRPVSQPAHPPIPPQAPPVQRAPTGPEMPPVAEPGIGQAGQKPSSEVESSASLGQPSQA